MLSKWQKKKFLRRKRTENPEYSVAKIKKDPFLFRFYELYLIKMLQFVNYDLDVYEIGSAGGITFLLQPEIITTDIRESVGVKKILDATNFKGIPSESVSSVIAMNTLHHLPNLENHFKEIERILNVGGRAIYIEPNWNFVSKCVFIFAHPEPFDYSQKSWEFDTYDPMMGNQALAKIIFYRDSEIFTSKFPNLRVVIEEAPLGGLSILLSGGVFQRTRVPSQFLLRLFEWELKHPLWQSFFQQTELLD